jgi:hypothetical protein
VKFIVLSILLIIRTRNGESLEHGRRALFPVLEQELFDARHLKGYEVNGVEVRRRMMELVERDVNGMDNDHSGFSASIGWLRRGWMKRFNMTLKTLKATMRKKCK